MFSRIGGPAYKPGLETSIALAAAFGNPERRFKSIHIAGTNGKGSTSHTLASILQAAGLKTALYTSPHLVDFRERIRIDGKMIPHERVVDFVERWKKLDYPGSPSFFELTMMMAFDWFASEEVDFAVIEVGMGGRLDSTNILRPELSVITNISKDHTQFLGATLPAIATEKAGIIKPGVPVVVGESEGEVREVFALKSARESAPVVFADDRDDLLEILDDGGGLGWKARSPLAGEFLFPLAGDYQKKNLRTVLAAVETMSRKGILNLEPETVRRGLEGVVASTGFMGRWSVVENGSEGPLVICDTGHNEAGLSSNMAQLQRVMGKRPGGRLKIVAGFVADKAIDEILRLFPKTADYYLTQARIPRALPADELAEKFRQAGLPFKGHWESVAQAYARAREEAGPEDVIYVGGSTFVVADFLDSVETRNQR